MSYFDENEQNDQQSEFNGAVDRPADTAEGGSVEYTPTNNYAPQRGPYPFAGAGTWEDLERARATQRRRNGILAAILAFVLLAVTLLGGMAIGRLMGDVPGDLGGGNGDGNSSLATPTLDRGDISLDINDRESNYSELGTIPGVVRDVKDTVVEIRTETTVNSVYYGEYVESGAGSGVIIAENGLVLTCNHVIEGAGTITVVLTDGSSYIAEVYGTDSWSDLALLKISATDLPYATLATAMEGKGPYSYMAVGESVIAIGNPLGELGGSVTAGIISALGRDVTVEGIPMTLMQIDASVNPGNSGGGLFNLYGELIGIVNAKSSGEQIEGIGFAIPSSDAIAITAQLYKQGYVSGRPFLGLYFSSDMQITAYDYNDELSGENKIQSGDYLYSADGIVLDSLSDLRTILAGKSVGDKIEIQVMRYVQSGRGYVQKLIDFELTVHEYVPTAGASESTAG